MAYGAVSAFEPLVYYILAGGTSELFLRFLKINFMKLAMFEEHAALLDARVPVFCVIPMMPTCRPFRKTVHGLYCSSDLYSAANQLLGIDVVVG